ncbi:MAG: M15 family metallopeptidase, partial [Pirellulales bacterium]
MIVFNVDNVEVFPIVGMQGAEFTFRFVVSSASEVKDPVSLYVEFDTGFGWWRAATVSTKGGTIEHKKVIQGAGARRVRIASDYPTVKLTGETRKNFMVRSLASMVHEFGHLVDAFSICKECRFGRADKGKIDVAVYYRMANRNHEGRAGTKHDILIQSLFDARSYKAEGLKPLDANGWFATSSYGSSNPFRPGKYVVTVTPSVGRGRQLGRDTVVCIDSATEAAFGQVGGPGEGGSGIVEVFPDATSRIDFVVQAEETWSERTNTNIATVHPELRLDLRNVINKIEGYNDHQLTIADAFRTFAEQDDEYKKGRAGGPPGSSIVTNARGGESYHNYGLAVDAYNIQSKGLVALTPDDRGVFDMFDFEWGGSFGDPPHFQQP